MLSFLERTKITSIIPRSSASSARNQIIAAPDKIRNHLLSFGVNAAATAKSTRGRVKIFGNGLLL